MFNSNIAIADFHPALHAAPAATSQPSHGPARTRHPFIRCQSEWLRRVAAARRQWDRLSARELRETEGKERRLARLLTQYYGIETEQAREQAREFLRGDGNAVCSHPLAAVG